jgi:ATP-dependent DNA helicase RecG
MDSVTRLGELEKIYKNQVGLVHGKMKPMEKEEAMQKFKNGDTRILVATTVIEVGIDIPDATLIIIENAEKFGLATLHQLRGRVGRSNLQSHAILLYEERRTSQIAKKRLSIMKKSEDGFYIAEEDLKLRGGGENIRHQTKR